MASPRAARTNARAASSPTAFAATPSARVRATRARLPSRAKEPTVPAVRSKGGPIQATSAPMPGRRAVATTACATAWGRAENTFQEPCVRRPRAVTGRTRKPQPRSATGRERVSLERKAPAANSCVAVPRAERRVRPTASALRPRGAIRTALVRPRSRAEWLATTTIAKAVVVLNVWEVSRVRTARTRPVPSLACCRPSTSGLEASACFASARSRAGSVGSRSA